MTLYVLLSSAGFFLINASFNGGVQAIPSGSALVNLLLLAFLPTLVSNLALVRAIKSIGSTLTSVLGAMEPLTAIVIGVVVFGETISGTMALGDSPHHRGGDDHRSFRPSLIRISPSACAVLPSDPLGGGRSGEGTCFLLYLSYYQGVPCDEGLSYGRALCRLRGS